MLTGKTNKMAATTAAPIEVASDSLIAMVQVVALISTIAFYLSGRYAFTNFDIKRRQ